MLLPRSTRDQLLTKVNDILQTLSEVVSVLSKSSQEDVTSQEDQEQLWWDNAPSVSQLVSPVDSALYTLSFLTDDDGGLSDVGQWSIQEQEEVDDVFSGPSPSDSAEDVSSPSPSSDVIVNPSLVSQSQASSNIIDDLISFVGVAAPAGVYNAAKARRRKKRRCDKAVVPELRSIWQNVERIFASPPKPRSPGPPPSYTVDWSDVNVRSLNNLPKPKLFPKLGPGPYLL